MSHRSRLLPDRATELPAAKVVFAGLLVALLAIAVGHLYAVAGLTARIGGLPAWLLVQLVVVFAMLAIAWLAVRVVALAADGGA